MSEYIMAHQNIDVSVITLTLNSEKYIERCLLSVLDEAALSGHCIEVLIMDNGSERVTVDILNRLAERHPEVDVTLLNRNFGTTYPRNLAIRKASGEFLFIIDSDVELESPVISPLKETLIQDERVGLAVPRIRYPDGRIQKSTDFFPTLPRKIRRYFWLREMERELNGEPSNSENIDYAISAAWFLRRDHMMELGGFDENIFYAPEDADFCLQLRKAGYRVAMNPDATVIHHTQELSRGRSLNAFTMHHIKGLFYYFRKHGYWLRRPVL